MGESAEVVRRLYRAMNEREPKTIDLLTSEDAEWVPDERVGRGPVRGRERVLEFFDDRAEAFEDLRNEPEEVSEVDASSPSCEIPGSGPAAAPRSTSGSLTYRQEGRRAAGLHAD